MTVVNPLQITRRLNEAVSRLMGLVSNAKLEIDLTTLLRCRRLWFFEVVAKGRGGDAGDKTEEARVDLVKAFGHFLHSLVELPGCIQEPVFRIRIGEAIVRMKPDFWCPPTRAVVELKTVARLVNIPRLNHIAQLKSYMAVAGAEKGYLVYISRTTGEVRVYEFRPSLSFDELVEALRERLKGYLEYVDGGSRGAPGPEPGIWCRNCPYRRHCNVTDEARMGETELDRLLKKLAGKG